MANTDGKVECPVCGYDVGTKENGTKLKAHKVRNKTCAGSDELVQTDLSATDGIDKGGSYEAQDSPQGSRDETSETTDPKTPAAPETGTQGVASSSAREFTHSFAVRKPCPHLSQADAAWHAENTKMVDKLARKAGLVPTCEPRHTGNVETATHVLVTYAVPVK